MYAFFFYNFEQLLVSSSDKEKLRFWFYEKWPGLKVVAEAKVC